MDARGVVVTLHPTSPPGWEQTAFGRPRPMVEFLFDTTRCVVDMALSGTLARYPRIRWIVPHPGAVLPVALDALLKVATPDRLLYGSDCPFTPPQIVTGLAAELRAAPALQETQLAAVPGSTAAALFPRLSGS